ncbi:MAG TPA: hypothetical protein VMD74_00415 [Candidatus Methylomirabilis sp.]|nr:hypothetical protein [Candidatus Methylomirabilis sp.]
MKASTVIDFGCGSQPLLINSNRGHDNVITSFAFRRQGKNFLFREAEEKDVKSIVRLERKCWGEAGATEEMIISRIKVFREGSWLALVHDKVGGDKLVGYGVYEYVNEIDDKNFSWFGITDNGLLVKSHQPKGDWLYGVNLSVVPEAAEMGVSENFISCLTIKELIFGGRKGLYLGSRMPGFASYCQQNGDLDANVYVQQRTHGHLIDPQLSIYEYLGFKVVRVLPNYFTDPESRNNGVLVLKTNHDF